MKYLLSVLMVIGLLSPSLTKAEVMGFLDGNMYDPVSGTWRCMFLMDGNCYDLEQKVLTTRAVGSVAQAPSIPQSTPQTVYVPVYIPAPTTQTQEPVNQPAATAPTPIVLKPAYTEAELLKKMGQTVITSVDGRQKQKILPVNITPLSEYNATAVSITLVNGYCPQGSCKINFQGQTIISNATLASDQSGDSQRYQISNLTPYTLYTFEFVYIEEGRTDTVITKQFQTTCGTLCFY